MCACFFKQKVVEKMNPVEATEEFESFVNKTSSTVSTTTVTPVAAAALSESLEIEEAIISLDDDDDDGLISTNSSLITPTPSRMYPISLSGPPCEEVLRCNSS